MTEKISSAIKNMIFFIKLSDPTKPVGTYHFLILECLSKVPFLKSSFVIAGYCNGKIK